MEQGQQEYLKVETKHRKKVIITGGSRGIGAGIARRLARGHWDVVLTYKKEKKRAEDVVADIRREGGVAHCISGDVSTFSQGEALMQTGVELLGGLDALVCNAGVSYMGLLTDMTQEQWHEVMETNLSSLFYCTRSVVPHFVSRKKGHIVTLSSMWGQVGGSCEVAYSASKAGVIGFTKALALELAPSQIYVNCVAPGVIDTDMISMLTEEDKICLKEETPLGRLGTVEDVAEVVEFLVNSNYLTGQVVAPNGGLIT